MGRELWLIELIPMVYGGQVAVARLGSCQIIGRLQMFNLESEFILSWPQGVSSDGIVKSGITPSHCLR